MYYDLHISMLQFECAEQTGCYCIFDHLVTVLHDKLLMLYPWIFKIIANKTKLNQNQINFMLRVCLTADYFQVSYN